MPVNAASGIPTAHSICRAAIAIASTGFRVSMRGGAAYWNAAIPNPSGILELAGSARNHRFLVVANPPVEHVFWPAYTNSIGRAWVSVKICPKRLPKRRRGVDAIPGGETVGSRQVFTDDA